MSATMIAELIGLSHEFGGPDYVKGGGGNTSVKSDDTLWVKPSGTTLAGLTAEALVAMDRTLLGRLFAARPPDDARAREALVKDMMAAAVRPGVTGRPSVEAPLHDSFKSRFVVHTHPPLVNGMTCAKEGAAVSRRLFPDALWIGYVDPGYTLCMHVRREIAEYVTRHGREPAVVMLENHGVFVAADTPEEIRAIYGRIFRILREAYAAAGVATTPAPIPEPPPSMVEGAARDLAALLGADAAAVTATGPFAVPNGPITPDHIVYAKSYPLRGRPSAEAIGSFRAKHGYAPRVVSTGTAVLGAGTNAKNAALALELAQDGALVEHLATAFGGVRYLSDRARDFIDNWEVESYRRQVAARG